MCFGVADQPRRCVYRGLPAGELGAACAADAECQCIALPDGTCREFQPCVAEGETTCGAAEPEPGGCGCRARGGAAPSALAVLVLAIAGTRRRRLTAAGGRARRTARTAAR
jgi:hypothetical protein